MKEWYVLLLWLVIAHTLTDFYLQPMSWVNDRNRQHYRSIKLIWHALLHGAAACSAVAVWQATLGWGLAISALYYALVIAASHYLIDLAKSYSSKGVIPFLLDQLCHLLVILFVAWHAAEPPVALSALLQPLNNISFLVLITGYLLVLQPASVFTRMLLERWQFTNPDSTSLPQAGSLIGQLERLLLLSCVLLDSWAAIGFILAAKSIFRFGDLTQSRDRKLTEYVMLGTLISVLIAFAIGTAVKPFLTLTP